MAESDQKYPQELLDHYVIKDTIGSGGFAKVKVARHKMTGEKVAIKVMDKAALKATDDLKRVALEIQALKDLKHQHISRLYQALETETKHYLVLEYAPGGELFDYIVQRDRCKEDEARVFFRQIISALWFCHSKGYAHRDLKPENLLLDANQNIKLIDFGLVGHPKNLHADVLHTCCGSAAYAAPELIRGEPYLGEPADMWSLGILLYALLCGFLPFDDENTQRLYRLIQRGQYEVPPWLSEDSQKLIAGLLKHKPDQRLTMDQLLTHPWVLKGLKVDRLDPASHEDGRELEGVVIRELAKFYSTESGDMETLVKEWKYDHLTAEYELLALRRRKGHQIRLPGGKGRLSAEKAMQIASSKPVNKQISITIEDSEGNRTGRRSPPVGLAASSSLGSMEHLSLGPFMHIPGSMENLHIEQKEFDRLREDAASAATAKPRRATFAPPSPLTNLSNSFYPGSVDNIAALSKKSDDSGVPTSPMRKHTSNPALSPVKKRDHPEFLIPPVAAASGAAAVPEARTARNSSSLRSSFNSLARSVMSVFGSARHVHEPRKVKGLFNVSTTSTKQPSEVYTEVLRVLRENNVEIKEKGFVIKAKVMNKETGKVRVTMTFEVCRLDRMDLRGLRLTRVKGDTWEYKKVCNELLSQMKL